MIREQQAKSIARIACALYTQEKRLEGDATQICSAVVHGINQSPRRPLVTPLEKTLRRSMTIKGMDYVVTLTPAALKITLKGHRIGLELPWEELVSGERALAVALQASVGQFGSPGAEKGGKARSAKVPMAPAAKASKRAARTHLPVGSTAKKIRRR